MAYGLVMSTAEAVERTRSMTRTRLADVAWELMAERGVDDVSVEEVCAQADVPPGVFHRAFATKEHAVAAALEAIGDRLADQIRVRPQGEDAWTALRHAFDGELARHRGDPAAALAGARLAEALPAVRERRSRKEAHELAVVAAALGRRLGRPPHDLGVVALVAAALGGVDAAVRRWMDSDGAEDLEVLIDETFAAQRVPAPALGPMG
jgi:AcrR family transcriptional regulator